MEGQNNQEARYIGIDLGKRTYEMAVVGKGGKAALSNGKTSIQGRQALYKKLRPQDKVALEAGNLAFIMAKEIEAAGAGCRVYVLNPSRLAVIYASMSKTDKEDSLKLAHILEDFREERLPAVAVPGDEEMRRRKLLAGYRREQQSRTRTINRLHGLFMAQGITTMKKKDLATTPRRQEAAKQLEGFEREEAEHLLQCLELYEARIAALDKRIDEEAAEDGQMQRLQTVPGVGPKVSFAFVAHVAAERFENAAQVSNYLGLVPRVYISGDTVRYGKITKRGNGYVRALLVQAAWSLARTKQGGNLKLRYEYMTKEKGMSKKKTIVGIARRLAVLLYTLMRDGTGYEARPFTADRQAGKTAARLALSA